MLVMMKLWHVLTQVSSTVDKEETQAVTIRLLDCQGQSFLLRAIMTYRRIAQAGKFKSQVSLHQSYHTSYKHQKSCPEYLQTVNIFQLFNGTYMLFLGMFGQAVLWPSLPDRETKKKENCHSMKRQLLFCVILSQLGNPSKDWDTGMT